MKTNQLILAAAALVVLASCTKVNVVDNATLDNEIGFRAVSSMNTKANNAIISGTDYGQDNTFQVWGWRSGANDFSDLSANAASNFMSNLTISWTKGYDTSRNFAWRNAEKYYYWPYTGKIAFLAIHPSTVAPNTTGWNATADVPEATITNYTIGTENKTTDLMFANAEGQKRADALPMKFKHALSQIVVNVKTYADYKTKDGVKFDVENVTFNNIDLSGDVAYEWDATPPTPAMAINWTNNTTQTASWVYYDTILEDITNVAQVYGAANVMIPQPASVVDDPATENAIEGTYLYVKYSMQQGTNPKTTGTAKIPKPQLWEAGKKYVYTLNFKLDEILFDPDVTDWIVLNVDTIDVR